ncbi:MAG: tetratricopeptide repeat protein [Chlorobiaceae bacterium]|jgi:tetratricopeptide (TPR) repeat protein|nr:tetratricopeptide repeat protein [Chlorobiaceae bacterium]NTW63738.1 tetratricopeptide repeat protein [Chlorobiaceae bacterium]
MNGLLKQLRAGKNLFLPLILLSGMMVLVSCNKQSKEISSLQQEVWKNPGDADANIKLGTAYARNRQYVEADKAFTDALALDPKLEEAYAALGAIAFNQKKYERALKYFNTYLSFSPEDSLRNYDVGNVYLQMKQYEPAIAAYRKAIATSTSFEDAYYNLGFCYTRTGRNAEALEIYNWLVNKNNYLAVSLKNHLQKTDSVQ